ncbi:MAG: hypothetical protein RI959_134 [Pseudomonadota bacterium]
MTSLFRRWCDDWLNMPLPARIGWVMLLLLLLVQAAGFWTVRGAMERQTRSEIASTLAVGQRVWQRLQEQNAQRLREASTVLASDFGFRSAIGTADKETIDSALNNSAARIGASVAALLDPQFRLVGASLGDNTMAVEVLRGLAAQAAQDTSVNQVALIGGQPYQFVMVPVKAPVVIAWVMMGFPLNQALVNDFHQLSGLHASLWVTPEAATTQHWGVASLPGSDLQLAREAPFVAAEIAFGSVTYAAQRYALKTSGGTLNTVLMRSLDEVRAPYRELQWTLVVIALGGVLLFAFGSRWAAGRITRPLTALTLVTESLEQGQFDVAVGGTERRDEIGQLARGFDRMRASIASQREEILRLAYWDRLTGLPNREQFRQTLRLAIEGVQGLAQPLVVITLNVDRFKHVNDVLGYAFGDELLKAVAVRLQQQVLRGGDLVARLGGDEFAILLTRSDAQGAMTLTERIGKAFEAPLALGDQTVDLSASMGLACWPTDGADADTVMSRSEIAMHAAKSKTAGVLMYSPALDSSSSQTLSLLSDLRRALVNNELRLFLQPKLSTATGQVVAAEALVRWLHPSRGLVPPLQFIPFAEQTGFVRQLTLWMFEEAARQWAALQPTEGHLRVAINLSTRDLLDLDFPGRLASTMQVHGVTASAFCLEITESAIMDDPHRAETTLNRLAQQGFKLSIDDFGTGYSSLAYLKRLPVSELKIDKSFVMGMSEDASDAKIVRSTVDLAHNLGLSVVAEGVENASILASLRELGCDEAQGYHIAKPMPANEFTAWRERWYAQHPPQPLRTV